MGVSGVAVCGGDVNKEAFIDLLETPPWERRVMGLLDGDRYHIV
jgi:hypothetical protein